MALSGIHVECGFIAQQRNGQDGPHLLGQIIWSQTLSAPGTTTNAAPADNPGLPATLFSVIAAVDIFYAIGPTPNASTDPRRFLAANTPVDVEARPGDKLAWIAA